MKKVIITFFVTLLFSFTAQADCMTIAKNLVSNCLAYNVKLKGDKLFDKNPDCLQRRVDDISRAWQEFNFAVESKDSRRITNTAKSVRFQTQYRDENINSCWNTIKSECNITSNAIDSDISSISENFCM